MSDQTTPEGRTIDLSVEVPGTPQEVWDAIATGPGISSWFVPAEVGDEVGDDVALTFTGYGTETSTITAREPGRRFAYGTAERGEGLAYEWLVEARDGGSCVVRLVNSGFGEGDDWDAQYDGMTEGWGIFLQSLRLYLTHHRGSAARPSINGAMLPGPNAAAFERLCATLGIPADVAVGDRVASSGDAPALSGEVAHVIDHDAAKAILLRVDEPAPGTAFLATEGGGDGPIAASVWLYLHGDRPDVDTAWGSWLSSTFPAAD